MLVPLKIPPGVFANGTTYSAKGRWTDVSLVRWIDGAMQPVGGWRLRSDASAMTGVVRAMLAWKSNSGVRWIACASHSKLYARTTSDVVHDITPVGFTAGRADAVAIGGFGSGPFGEGTFGTPRPDTGSIQPATVCSLDSWGERLVFCSPDDGKVYEWDLNTANPAAVVSGAPTTVDALVVTAERFLFALYGRTVKWCDQADNTTWTPAATNQAGEVDLQTHGSLKCGLRVQGGTLLFTDTDAHLASFIGGVFVHRFDRVGNNCGVAGPGAAVSLDSSAVWMGRENFWIWNGGVQALPSEVSDLVFSDFNQTQASKVTAFHNSAYGEVWWFYPSGSSNEIDRAVSWSYRDNIWSTHRLPRTCMVDRGVFQNPLAATVDGLLYEHETGFNYDGTDGPYAESGPFEIGVGERLAMVRKLIPDERTGGDVSVRFAARMYPNGAEVFYPPEGEDAYTLSSPTDVLFQARQVALRIEPVRDADWRWGEPRVDVMAGSKV